MLKQYILPHIMEPPKTNEYEGQWHKHCAAGGVTTLLLKIINFVIVVTSNFLQLFFYCCCWFFTYTYASRRYMVCIGNKVHWSRVELLRVSVPVRVESRELNDKGLLNCDDEPVEFGGGDLYVEPVIQLFNTHFLTPGPYCSKANAETETEANNNKTNNNTRK